MLQIINLSKSYSEHVLFEDVNFSVNSGERLGVVGRNGHGKSTLFKLILGQEDPDSGNIMISDGYKVGHLAQHLNFTEDTILKEAALSIPKNPDGWEETYKAEAILMGLGFKEEQFHQSPDTFSGGYQIRLNLAKLLVSEPQLLLLDEPTNYLDILSLRWLARFLTNWPHELLLITHDRGFLDSVCTHTVAIHRNKVRKIIGSTSKMYEQIELEEEIHQKTVVNQQKQMEKTEQFVRRFRAKASKAKAVQSRVKALDKMDKLESLSDIESLDFEFFYKPFTGKNMADIKELHFGYEEDNPLIKDLSFTIKKNDRIGVIGKNGKGKTTLLNLLASELKNYSGTIEYSTHADVGYFGQTNVDRLDKNSTVEEEIRSVHPEKNRTVSRSICGSMMFSGDKALKKISVLSGGEKARVLLGKVLVTPSNFLLLDEPTNHLDMYAHDALIDAIDNFPGALMMVTHSEEMLERVVNRLIVFDDEKTFIFEGGYKEFLKKIGWKDEDTTNEDKQKSQKKTYSKKELRQLKAAIQNKKKEETKELSKSTKKLESTIMTLEEEVGRQNDHLVDITKDGYGDDATKLTRDIAEKKERIDILYKELEVGSDKLSEIEVKYQKELDDLK